MDTHKTQSTLDFFSFLWCYINIEGSILVCDNALLWIILGGTSAYCMTYRSVFQSRIVYQYVVSTVKPVSKIRISVSIVKKQRELGQYWVQQFLIGKNIS